MAKIIRGKCHCGATAFEVSGVPALVTRCSCVFLLEARGPVGLLRSRAIQADLRQEPRLVLDQPTDPAALSLRHLRLRHLQRHAGLGELPDGPGKRKVPVNARLFEDFDLDAVPVVVLDGKNLV